MHYVLQEVLIGYLKVLKNTVFINYDLNRLALHKVLLRD